MWVIGFHILGGGVSMSQSNDKTPPYLGLGPFPLWNLRSSSQTALHSDLLWHWKLVCSLNISLVLPSLCMKACIWYNSLIPFIQYSTALFKLDIPSGTFVDKYFDVPVCIIYIKQAMIHIDIMVGYLYLYISLWWRNSPFLVEMLVPLLPFYRCIHHSNCSPCWLPSIPPVNLQQSLVCTISHISLAILHSRKIELLNKHAWHCTMATTPTCNIPYAYLQHSRLRIWAQDDRRWCICVWSSRFLCCSNVIGNYCQYFTYH